MAFDRVHRFNPILLAAAKFHVGKSKAGRYTKPWSTPGLREAIKKRNALRRTVADNRAEYLEACAATHKLSEESRKKKWEEFLADQENNPDPAGTWRTIKSLSGTPSTATFAEPLLYKGRNFTTNRGKANAFMKDCTAVNRLRFNKEERNCIRQLKSSNAGESCCTALRKEELDKTILQMSAKGAPGPDDIPPTFFKALGPRARQELLDIFNLSFSNGKSPQIWKIAIILSLRKAEKPPGCIFSYRPVSLTSCIYICIKGSGPYPCTLLSKLFLAEVYKNTKRNTSA